MCNYYLVDGENVNSTTTINVAKEKVTKEDIMIIFYTCNSSRSYEKINYLKEKIKCHVMTMKVQNGSKNSLDFQLVSYLGLLIGDNKAKGIECSYNIVSNDKGYLSTINLLTNCANVNVNLISVKNIHNNKLCNTIHINRNIVEAHISQYNVNIDTKGMINPKEVILQLQDVLELCKPISDHIGKKLELSRVVDSTFDLMVNNISGNNISFSVC